MSLKALHGIGDKSLEKLSVLGVEDVSDLAYFAPVGYIDLAKVTDLSSALRGDFILLNVVVFDAKPLVRRGKRNFFIAYCYADGVKIKLVWYNQPYVAKSFKKDCLFVVYGKLDFDGLLPMMVNVKFEPADDVKNLQGVSPIYRTRGYFSQHTFSKLAKEAAAVFVPSNGLSVDVEKKFGLMPLSDAIVKMHSPSTVCEGESARRRVYYEIAFAEMRRYKDERNACRKQKLRRYDEDVAIIDAAVARCGFVLTDSQSTAVRGMLDTLRSDVALNAMLLGDVGSGKTIVALLLAYYAAKCGHQTAVLAPTGILAQQHYKVFCSVLDGLGVKIALCVGDASRRAVAGAAEDADILIGTHALLSPVIKWRDLGLLIVDEQHRFGIKQREQLLQKGCEVDFLSMSATPIPRSLGLTYFGATEAYRLDNRVNRSAVRTRVVGREKLNNMLAFIADEARAGKKCFVVAPAICDIEGVEMSGLSATQYIVFSDSIYILDIVYF